MSASSERSREREQIQAVAIEALSFIALVLRNSMDKRPSNNKGRLKATYIHAIVIIIIIS